MSSNTVLVVEDNPSAGRGRSSGLRLLVVDDDHEHVETQSLRLRERGFEVETTSDPFEGLARARKNRPDAIVSDLLMPQFDGFKLCWAVRLDPMLRDIPFVLVSSRHLGDEELELAGRVGASAVLDRSPHLDVLVDAIDRATRTRPPSSGPVPLSSLAEAHGAVSEVRNKFTIPDSQSDVPYQSWHSIITFLTQLGEFAAHPRQVDAVLREVLDNFLGAAGFPSGSAYLMTGEDNLELRAHVGPPEASPQALATFFGHKPYLESIVRRHMPVVLGGPFVSTEERAILDASGAGAKLVMPLVLNGRALGVTVLSSPSRETRPDLTAIARAIAGPVTQAVALALTMSELDRSEHRLQSIAETVGDGVLVTDDAGRTVYANSAAVRLLSVESIAGSRIADLLPFFDFNGPRLQQGVVSPPGRDPYTIEVAWQVFGDGSAGASRIYAVRDLTERFQLVELERLANHDSLTGLSNRRRFDEDLATRVQEGWRHGVSTSLVLMDLDNFKTINDTWGHAAGDEMLRAVGRVLRRVTRRSDLPARLGGDEFAVLLSHTGASGALACTHKLHARLAAEKVEIGGHIVPIIASIGAAAFPVHAASGSALVEAADRALYCAKRQGRNRVCLADDPANTQRII